MDLQRIARTQPVTDRPPTGETAPVQTASANAPTPSRISIGDNLIAGNHDAAKMALQDGKQLLHHPVQAVGNAIKGMAQLVTSPGQVLSQTVRVAKHDRVDGAIQGAGVGAGYLGIAAAATLGVAYAAAIPTKGRSFRLLGLAGDLAKASGNLGLAAMAGSFVKNEVDVATAKTVQARQQQSRELAGDFDNIAVAGGLAAGGIAVQKGLRKIVPLNVNPSCGQRVADRLNGRIAKKLGLVGDNPNPELIRTNGMSVEQLRQAGIEEVQRGLKQGSQGGKILQVNNIDRGNFAGIDNVGDKVMMFHGTRDIHSESIRTNGLMPSKYGDFGEGVYLGTTGKIGENYASGVAMRETAKPRVMYSLEVATGKVFDYVEHRADFEAWAKSRFNPADASNAINKVYANLPKTSTSPFADLTWNRYMKLYCEEKGYNSIRIRDWDGLGQHYYVVHDPNRIIVRQEFHLDPPKHIRAVPGSFNGVLAGSILRGAAQPATNAPQ